MRISSPPLPDVASFQVGFNWTLDQNVFTPLQFGDLDGETLQDQVGKVELFGWLCSGRVYAPEGPLRRRRRRLRYVPSGKARHSEDILIL